jgi:DNA-binding NarL/FixJ family response regulator
MVVGDSGAGPGSAGRSELIGREADLAALRARWRGLPGLRGTTLVSGEAGLGKSRFAAEAYREAAGAGVVTLVGQCDEGAAAIHAPLALALRRWCREQTTAQVDALFDGAAQAARHLLTQHFPAGAPPGEVDVAVVEVVSRLAGRRGLLLVVEDVQWAGEDTGRLLVALARETGWLPLRMVLTLATDEMSQAAATLRTDLLRQPQSEEIRLRPLDLAAVAAMVRAVAGDGWDSLAGALHTRTGGNPYAVEELLRASVAATGGVAEAVHIPLPDPVRATVLRGSRALSQDDREVLHVAAICGMNIDVPLLASATGRDHDAIRATIGRTLDRGILVESTAAPAAAFRDALMREAMSAELRGPKRVAVHARIARALIKLGRSDSAAGRIADHLQAAGAAAEAADHALAAARASAEPATAAEAALRYRQAIAAVEGERRRLDVILEAVEAMVNLVPDDVGDLLGAGLDAARRLGDTAAVSRLLVVDGWRHMWGGRFDAAVMVTEEAVRAVDGRDDHVELAALRALIARRSIRGDTHDSALLDRAGALATRLGDLENLAHITVDRISWATSDEAAAAACDAALAVARDAGDDALLAMVLLNCGFFAFVDSGELAQAFAWQHRGLSLAEQVGSPHTAVWQSMACNTTAYYGDLDGAAELSRRVLEADRGPVARANALHALIEVALRTGDLAAAHAHAAGLLEVRAAARFDTVRHHTTLGALRVELTSGGRAAALRGAAAFEQLSGEPLRCHWILSPDLARALAVHGAHKALDQLAVQVGALTVRRGRRGHDVAAWRYVEGTALAAHGDHAAARAVLAEAVALYEAMPCPARAGEAAIELAHLEWRTGDAEASLAAAERALTFAGSIAAPALQRIAARALRRAGGRAPTIATRPGPRPGGLTARELDVAALVAAGLSNREIAEALSIGSRTVASHVAHVLTRLDLRNRTELARWAGEHSVATVRTPAS